MVTLLVTFSRPLARIITVPEVVTFTHPRSGQRDMLLDARQSAEIVEAWKASQGEDATASLAGSTWRLSRSRSFHPREWSASVEWAYGREFWPMSAFPWDVIYAEGAAPQQTALGESEVLDAIAEHLNRYPDYDGSGVRDFVAKALAETGRTILA